MSGRCISKENLETTGFSYTLSLISGKYKMIILYTLMEFGVVRFNEMKKYIGGISYKTLSVTLKELESDGLVHREEYPQIPPRVEYSLTGRGESLIPILDRMCEWGERNRTPVTRCPWCLINEREIKYHDEEWGVPVHDDRKQFEYLMLEVMQCGLSWDTVLKKREIFRTCFDGFDFDKIAEYSESDVERILNAPGMIRSRRKIEAVIGNARCVRQIRKEFGSFSEYLWGWTKGKMLLYRGHELGNIPASNELSDRISRDLKKRGLKYIGSVTVYAHLQACGVINDHIRECDCYRRLIDRYDTEVVDP